MLWNFQNELLQCAIYHESEVKGYLSDAVAYHKNISIAEDEINKKDWRYRVTSNLEKALTFMNWSIILRKLADVNE